MKSTHVHHEVPVEAENMFRNELRHEVGMLVFRRNMLDQSLSPLDKFVQGAVPDINVRKVRVRHGAIRCLDRTSVVLDT